jgi:L-rhamnose mutarotase
VSASPGTERICFTLRVRPDRADEYRRRHNDVWGEMREALTAAGWRNYSLFLADGGLVIGYLECDDFDQVVARMQGREVNARWQAEMAPFFELDGGGPPDRAMVPLPEIFHLE